MFLRGSHCYIFFNLVCVFFVSRICFLLLFLRICFSVLTGYVLCVCWCVRVCYVFVCDLMYLLKFFVCDLMYLLKFLHLLRTDVRSLGVTLLNLLIHYRFLCCAFHLCFSSKNCERILIQT